MIVRWLVPALLLFFASPGQAQDWTFADAISLDDGYRFIQDEAGVEAGSEDHRSKEEREDKEVLIGFKGSAVATYEGGKQEEILLGAGLLYERHIIPGMFETEMGISMLWVSSGDESGWEVPVELVLKKPFHVNHIVNPYLAAGGLLVVEHVGESTHVRPGLTVHVGTYLWWDRNWGVDVEAIYNLVFAGEPINEAELGFGIVHHF